MFDFHDPLLVFGLIFLLVLAKDFEFHVPLAIVVGVGNPNMPGLPGFRQGFKVPPLKLGPPKH